MVYTGDISAGVCTGNGTLWTQDGILVYEGAFENNNFNGNGTPVSYTHLDVYKRQVCEQRRGTDDPGAAS